MKEGENMESRYPVGAAYQTAPNMMGAGQALSTPKTETVSELVNTLINIAGFVLQSSTTIAVAINGSVPQPTSGGDKAPSPPALADQLQMLRYILNEAEGELSRARSGLGV